MKKEELNYLKKAEREGGCLINVDLPTERPHGFESSDSTVDAQRYWLARFCHHQHPQGFPSPISPLHPPHTHLQIYMYSSPYTRIG